MSFNPSGPELHQPVVERKIRVVKERATVLIIAIVATIMEIGGAYLNGDMEGPAVHMRINKQVSDLLCQLDESYRPFVREPTVQLS